MKEIKVLSLFDGMSCGALALDEARVPIKEYHASEIDKWAIMVSKYNYPAINHVGDVTLLDPNDYHDFDLVIGGSPCQSLSVAGGLKGITTNHGEIITSLWQYQFLKSMGYSYDTKSRNYFNASALFWEFVRIYQGIKVHNPSVKFLLENVVNNEWEELISGEMGVKPIRINSSVVTPQNRDRFYWTNIKTQPIVGYNIPTLDSIIPDAVSGAGYRGVPQKDWKPSKDNPYKHKMNLTVRKDGLANCLTVGGKSTRKYLDIYGNIKDLTVTEAEALQTVPNGYTDVPGVSETQKFKMLGNGWTVDVITHFFKWMKYEFERKESYITLDS